MNNKLLPNEDVIDYLIRTAKPGEDIPQRVTCRVVFVEGNDKQKEIAITDSEQNEIINMILENRNNSNVPYKTQKVKIIQVI